MCDPTSQEGAPCFFQPSPTENRRLTCSLGYLPFLPSVQRFCSAEEAANGAHGAIPPTKHNVLCSGTCYLVIKFCEATKDGSTVLYLHFVHSGKSALEVIYSNRDFAKLGARSATTPKLEPTIDVVRMPETKYVLVMETSSSMSRYDWKSIRFD